MEYFEIPTKIHLCGAEWMPADGLVTEALKLRRNNIYKAFKAEIDAMYPAEEQ